MISETALGDSTVATASVVLRRQQKYSIHNSREESYFDPPINWCDYVEDYRTNTVFDVIGSIGGLFALLQSLHIVLFGQAMLWGLTGNYSTYLGS